MDPNRKIKVLHVVGAMNRAGTETMLMNLYRNIDHSLYQFDFISYSKEDAHYDREILQLNGKIIPLTKTGSIRQLYQAIKNHGPYDAVHAHTLFHCGIASLAAFLAGVKIRIAHAHTTLDHAGHPAKKMYQLLMRILITIFSTKLLACSRAAGDYLFGVKNTTSAKYTFFPNVIALQPFLQVPESSVKKFKIKRGLANHLIIGHIGTFKESKNHAFLLAMMQRLIEINPTANLLLVGDGGTRGEMEAKALHMGIANNVTFHGISDDIPTLLHCMDVFVFPSIYEGLGLVLLEAQATGTPCLVSEAIQPEADVGLGLINRLTLADGPEEWAEKVIHLSAKKEKNKSKIVSAFENSGYSLQSGITLLENLYSGGAHEKNADCLL